MSAVSVISETHSFLVRCVVGDYYRLQDFGENEVSCLSKEAFDTLATGEKEANLGVNLSAWSVLKLERGNVDLCSTLRSLRSPFREKSSAGSGPKNVDFWARNPDTDTCM